MSETSIADKTIRKIRKKLRQIQHLELLDRELNDEEYQKVKIKGNLRIELRELLEEHYPDEAAAMKRTGSYLPLKKEEVSPEKKARSSGIGKNTEENIEENVNKENDDKDVVSKTDTELSVPTKELNHQPIDNVENIENKAISCDVVPTPRGSIHEEPTHITKSINKETDCDKSKYKSTQSSLPQTKELENKSKPDSKKVTKKDANPKKSIKSIWKDSEYHIYNLEGHNDLVIAVDCIEDYVISGSRDTMVKVWKVGNTKEERTLRGHTGSVTGVAFLPDTLAAKTLDCLELKLDDSTCSNPSTECKILAVSIGLDCTLKLWDIISGDNHGSIYTYNGMTALGCGSWGVAVGTEGGKLEVWCLSSGQRLAALNAFQSQVSTICVKDDEIFAGSMDGEVGVWKYDQQNHSLASQYVMEAESSTYIPLRRLSALCTHKGVMYLGDTGPNIKTLDWKYGISDKLANHLGEMGMTDSLTVHESGHLLSSSYHMDSGYPSINVRDLTSGSYICSLLDNNEGRYLTMASATDILITGGHFLKVWQRLPKGSGTCVAEANIEIIIPSWVPRLSQSAQDSSDGETDWASSSEDEDLTAQQGSRGRKSSTAITGGSSQGSWCVIM